MKQVIDKLALIIVLCLTLVGTHATALAQTTYTLTLNGIGPVQLGVKASELPESVPQLYDSKMSDVYIDEEMPDDEDMPEFATWYFYDEEGETVFTATQDSLGYICEISISSPNILTPEGIHVGTPQQQLDKTKGALRIDPDPMADETFARLSYVLNGITYWVDSYLTDDEHTEDRVASITISDPVLTAEGIGPVRIGTKASDLPESSPRLYASRVLGNGKTPPTGNPTDWHFLDDKGNELFTAEQDDEGLISEITITAPNLTTFLGVHPGMSLQQVEELRGEPLSKPLAKDAYISYDLYDIALNVNKAQKGLDKNAQLITSLSVPGVAYDRVNYVIGQVMPYYSSCTSFSQLESHLNDIRNIDGIESAYTDGSTTLYVNVLEFGSVSFSVIADDFYTIPLFKEELMKIIPGSHEWNNRDYNTFTVANQLENDLESSVIKGYTDMAINMFVKSGYENVKYSSPTIDFFLNDIFNNDMVFLITHGGYDEVNGVCWLRTSDIAGYYNPNKKKWIGTSIYQKFKHLCKTRFMGLSFNKEKRQHGVQDFAHIKVSDLFICCSERSFPNNPAIVFNAACQSFKHDNMAKAFAGKGAIYLGYDEINSVGVCGGLQFFSRILSGMNVNDAFNSMDKTAKKDPVRKAELHIFPEDNKKYFFYPRRTSFQFELPTVNRVVNNKLVDEQWIKFSTNYVMPLLYFGVTDARNYKTTFNENIESIPLEYGFQLSKNEDFNESETLTLKTELKKSHNVTSEDQSNEVRFSCNLDVATVSLDLSFNMLLNICPFWNPQKECLYLRPIVYNKNSGFVSYGKTWKYYKNGGPSDPNHSSN